jgi:hypothetical protein
LKAGQIIQEDGLNPILRRQALRRWDVPFVPRGYDYVAHILVAFTNAIAVAALTTAYAGIGFAGDSKLSVGDRTKEFLPAPKWDCKSPLPLHLSLDDDVPDMSRQTLDCPLGVDSSRIAILGFSHFYASYLEGVA